MAQAAGAHDRAVQPLQQRTVVGQSGQRVVVRQRGRTDLGFAAIEVDVDEDNAMQSIKDFLAAGYAVTISSNWSMDDFDVGDEYVSSHCYEVLSVNDDGTITLRNPWHTDAGSEDDAWFQGDKWDGIVTFDQSWIIEYSKTFTVGQV